MKLLQLYYFRTACEYQSITKAAEALHISQPSVSIAIRELENEFGLTLLLRKGKNFALTQEGQIFLRQTEGLLNHANDFEISMMRLNQEQEPLRLGVPPMIGSILLPLIYADPEFLSQNLKINILEAGRQELLYQLNNSQLDLAFLPHAGADLPGNNLYRSIPVMQLETVACVSLMHRLANRRSVSVWDLKEEPLVLFKNSFFQTESILKRFEEQRLTPQILLQTEQLSTIRKFVARNIASGFLFSRISEPIRDLVSIQLDPPMPVKVSLFWKEDSWISRIKSGFIHYIQNRIF